MRFGYPANLSFRSDSGPGSVSLVLSVPPKSLRESLLKSFAIAELHSSADRVVVFYGCALRVRCLRRFSLRNTNTNSDANTDAVSAH